LKGLFFEDDLFEQMDIVCRQTLDEPMLTL